MNKQFCRPINKLRLFWLISSLFILSGCFKEKFPKDPLNTLSNQLVCRVNGNIWKSNELEFYSGFYNDHLYLRYSDGTSSSFVFIINPPYHQGRLILNHNTNSYPNIVDPQDYAGYEIWYPDLRTEEIYMTNANDTGEINFVLLDTLSKRIKGSFSFVGRDRRTRNMITITDGYFEYHQ